MTRLWYAGSRLDRSEQFRKDDDLLAQAWSDAAARLVTVSDLGVAVSHDHSRLDLSETAGAWDAQRHFLLGRLPQERDRPVFVTAVRAAEQPGRTFSALRSALAGFDDLDTDLAVVATAITNWHRLDPFCPGCGSVTTVHDGGFARRCDSCGRETFPRNDSAVIVGVVDEQDRLLLGRQASWPAGRASVLAGFVESGESLEHAVHREMAEESGLPVTDVTYVGSQPWPFPRSLMVGFYARAHSADLAIDQNEIVAAEWYTRAQIAAVLAEGTESGVDLAGAPLQLPGRISIAHRIIRDWVNGSGPKPGSPDA